MSTAESQASPSLADRDAKAQLQLTTLGGWRDFVTDAPSPPTLLTEHEYRALTETERAMDDEDRIDHHARTQVVATPTIRHIVTCGRRQVLMNRNERGAHRGLLVSGPAGTGKSMGVVPGSGSW